MPTPTASSFQLSPFVEIANGLNYPESPVWSPDGSIYVVEVGGGCLTRLTPDTASPNGYRKELVAQLGGGPNGSAFGPDGCLYICNNGGLDMEEIPMPGGLLRVPTFADQPGKPIDYLGGSLQRVDLTKGAVETVCGNPFRSPEGLRSPDDLVFDESGGCWFTDWGKEWCATREYGSIRYLARGAKEPVIVNTNAHARRNAPNGIALSKDGRTLFVAETYARWTRKWALSAPGTIVTNPLVLDSSELHCASFPEEGRLDSMKMDDAGNLWVVTILTFGLNPTRSGGISIVSPEGKLLEYLEINIGMADPLPSNLCFGGADRQTLFVTLGGTGRVVCCRVSTPGLALNWQSY